MCAWQEPRATRPGARERARLEVLGRLTGPVLHDLNNLLMLIGVEAEILLAEGEPSSASEAGLRRIVAAIEEATQLSQALLSGARTNPGPVVEVDLDARLDELMPLLRRLGGGAIECRRVRSQRTLRARVRTPELDQVILNLFTNAVHALGGKGTVTVETDGEQQRFSIEDNGPGIDREIAARIFEPYFTTKPAGEGTGMGLALAAEAVRGWGAELRHEPGREDGARFTVSWNWQAAKPARVLLVEDERALRYLLARALRLAGYQVTEAGSAAAALERFQKAAGDFDLLITDLSLPDRPGEQLRQDLSAMPALLISGYPAQPRGKREAVLTKPFSTAELMRAVQGLLRHG